MTATSAPAAKAGLLTLLRARAALTGVQVEWAHPGQLIEPESVFLLGVQSDEVPATLGQQRRDETYTLEVAVTVHRPGDDPQACEERAWALAAEVEAAVRGDRTLNGAVSEWAMVQGMTQQPFIEGEGRVCEIVVRVECRSRK